MSWIDPAKKYAKAQAPEAYDRLYRYYQRGVRLYHRLRLHRRGSVVIELAGPFERYGERGWRRYLLEVDWLADRAWPPHDSPVELFEDDRRLGPAHATLEEISTKGGGRYAHLGLSIFFSTPDGSDPNTNGRRYRCEAVIDPDFPVVDWRFVARSWTWSAVFGAFLVATVVLPQRDERWSDR